MESFLVWVVRVLDGGDVLFFPHSPPAGRKEELTAACGQRFEGRTYNATDNTAVIEAAADVRTTTNNAQPIKVQQPNHTKRAHLAKRLVLTHSKHAAKYGC